MFINKEIDKCILLYYIVGYYVIFKMRIKKVYLNLFEYFFILICCEVKKGF